MSGPRNALMADQMGAESNPIASLVDALNSGRINKQQFEEMLREHSLTGGDMAQMQATQAARMYGVRGPGNREFNPGPITSMPGVVSGPTGRPRPLNRLLDETLSVPDGYQYPYNPQVR